MKNLFELGSDRKEFVKMSILSFMMWTSMASFPYTAVYLKEIGFSTPIIGLLISLGAILSIISQPMWGILSDGRVGVKKVMLITVFIAAVSSLLMGAVQNIVAIIIIFLIRAIAIAPVMTLIDNYIVQQSHISDGKIKYGSIRCWGSIGFAIATAILGGFSEKYGLEILFYFQGIILFLLVWLILPIVSVPKKDIAEHSRRIVKLDKSIFSLGFIVIVLFASFIMIPENALNYFFPIILQDSGGKMNMVGISSSIRALVEVPIFLSTNILIKKHGPRKIMMFASAFAIIRLMLILNINSPVQVFVANILGAPVYSLLIAGMLYYVYKTSPENSKNTAQLIASSVVFTLTQVVGSTAGGLILESHGTKLLAIVGLGFVVLGIIFYTISLKYKKVSKL